MGKSSASCFKMITCADSGSIDPDELQHASPSPSKTPSDKRGWSFRKKSSKHRVLSNTVITETPSSEKKESPGSTTLNSQTTAGASVTDKFVLPWPDEKSHQPISIESNVTENVVAQESNTKDDCTLEESVVISIQTSIRGFLAQRSLFKLKKLVKLQASVRGHLVRRHAVGTLRCVQAIIKMQYLVRARQTRISLERSSKKEIDARSNEEDVKSSQSKDRIEPTTKPAVTYTSIEKLLSNSFALRLIESSPKNKPMYIKCDSSRQDSPWQWMERWMSISSLDIAESQRHELSSEDKESENADKSFSHEEAESSSEVLDSANLKFSYREISVAPVVCEEVLTAHGVNDINFEACHPTSSDSKDTVEQALPENIDTIKKNHLENNYTQTHAAKSEIESSSVSGKYEVDIEQPKPSLKASEGLESQGKLYRSTSRKTTNPAFIAAQSKFEELGATPNLGATNSSSSQISGGDSRIDKVSSRKDDDDNGTKQAELSEDSVPHYTSLQACGSDCGTELSITSTLDSPDRFEIAPTEFDHEAKVSTEGETSIPVTTENIDVAVDSDNDDMHTISGSNLSGPAPAEPEKAVSDHGDSNGPFKQEKADSDNGDSYRTPVRVSFELVEQTPDSNPSDLQIELEPDMGHVAPYKSSSEVSPGSHMTVPESQGTPSSLVSTKATKVKICSSGSSNKRKSMSSSKRSPSTGIHDSSARDSMENMSKDTKSERRRNSFGSVKPDNGEQEQSASSSSNTLPSYMQATQSARAKVNANNSPRSSPDVQDKELYQKKRHSLPSSNGRDGSPRILKSLSQTQPGGKGNTQPQERKWQM